MNTNLSWNPKRTALAALLSLLVVGSLGVSQPAHAGGKGKGPKKPGLYSAVPEPGAAVLIGLGAPALAGLARRARRSAR